MIEKLEIKNFKSINDKLSLIEFKKLNILCGENASGKTSIIHAILLCTQSNDFNQNTDGSILKIGNYTELKNSLGGEINISLIDGNKKKIISYSNNEDLQSNQQKILSVKLINNPTFEFEKTIFYLSSNRTGTMDTYSKGNFLFGIDGANTISFLDEHQEDLLSGEYMQSFRSKYPNARVSQNRKFLEHVRFWMEEITGETISISPVAYTNQFILTFGNNIRPINTGTGYSFLLPIIISSLGIILLNETNGNIPTLILENPEIFLHPDAQCKLMKFFNFCKDFCQFIIETHSEYVIKSAVETNQTDTCVYVAKKDNGSTKLDNKTDFKTNSYLEILYRAFGIVTQEFHILLYGKLHEKFNTSENKIDTSVRWFDSKLKQITGVIKKVSEHKNKDGSITRYETLPTYIRNKIDHPEARDPVTKQEYTYTDEELKNSIDFLLSQL